MSALDALRNGLGETVTFTGVETAPLGADLAPVENPRSDAATVDSQKESRKEKLAREASAGGARPDIARAAMRMGWTFGGKREVRLLHEHVNADETVTYIAQGTYGQHQGITVLTDQRLLFVFHGWVNQIIEDFPLDRITSVSSKSGFSTGTLIVHTAGAQAEISSIVNSDLKYFIDALRANVTGSPGTTGVGPDGRDQDPVEQIRKLGELRDQGILTDEEFNAKKADLLKRI